MVCYSHPEGSGKSMKASASILCWTEADHTQAVIIGVVAFVVLLLPFITMVAYATIMYPRWTAASATQRSAHLNAFRFLFFRFRAEVHYGGSMFLLRNLGICL